MITTSTGPTADKRLGQVGVQVRPVDPRRIEHNPGIDRGDQFDQALIGEPGNPFGVNLSEPAHPDEDEPGGSSGRA